MASRVLLFPLLIMGFASPCFGQTVKIRVVDDPE